MRRLSRCHVCVVRAVICDVAPPSCPANASQVEAQIRALREEADQEAEAAEQRRRQERRRQKARLQQRLARKRAKKQAAKERRAAEQRAKMQAEEAAKVREQLRRMKEDDMEQELRSSVGFGTSGMPAGLNSSNMSLTGGLPSIGKPAAASPSGVTSNTSGGGNGMAGSPPSSVGFNPMPESSIAALKRQTLAPQGSARRLQALGTTAASATTSDARTSSETRTRRRRSLARRGSAKAVAAAGEQASLASHGARMLQSLLHQDDQGDGQQPRQQPRQQRQRQADSSGTASIGRGGGVGGVQNTTAGGSRTGSVGFTMNSGPAMAQPRSGRGRLGMLTPLKAPTNTAHRGGGSGARVQPFGSQDDALSALLGRS